MLFNFGFILFPLTLIESERALAEFLGLNVTGTLGILLKAKQQNKIPSFIACVKAMQIQGIRYGTYTK